MRLLLFFILAALPALAEEAAPALPNLHQVGNDILVDLILAVISALGTAGTALIGYVFAYLRRRWGILELTKLDERIEEKLLATWSSTRQGLYAGFKRQAGPGNKISYEQSRACMDTAIHDLYGAMNKDELKRLGIASLQEFTAWARTQFENITDASKGKLNIDLGKAARLAVGNIRTPVIGSELKGFEISTKF